MPEREDPYYPVPAQDPMWPAFEKFLYDELNWQRNWNFSLSSGVWWRYWLAFKAGVAYQRQHATNLKDALKV